MNIRSFETNNQEGDVNINLNERENWDLHFDKNGHRDQEFYITLNTSLANQCVPYEIAIQIP